MKNSWSAFSSNEEILKLLSINCEMFATDLLKHVRRVHNDHRDYYGVAALLHAGYLETDSISRRPEHAPNQKFGFDTQDIAVSLCQLMLPEGMTYNFNGDIRESWHNFPVRIFITSNGLQKLEEIEKNNKSRRQKRHDYAWAFLIAIVAAVAGAVADNCYKLIP